MKRTRPSRENISFGPLPFPWLFFIVFFLASCILSYSPLEDRHRWIFRLLGIALPLAVAIGLSLKRGKRGGVPLVLFRSQEDPQASIAWPLWGLFLVCLLVSRFLSLTSVPYWPLSDEGIFSILAMDLSREWHSQLFCTELRVEPLLI